MEHCGCEWTTSAQVDSYTTQTYQIQLYDTEQLNLYDLIGALAYKECNGNPIDTIYFELVQDNQSRTEQSDASFVSDYANSADTHLGLDAPSDKYVASTLGQESVLTSSSQDTFLDLAYDSIDTISGVWTFKVTGCVLVTGVTFECEEDVDRLYEIEILDPCQVDGYDFSVHGTTKLEFCGC